MKQSLILVAALFSSVAFANDNVECTRSAPEFGLPQVCVDRTPVPLKPTTNLNSNSTSSSHSAAEASNSLNIGGDNTKSVVAVFPPPSTAVVPQTNTCIVTKAVAGGIGWNLFQGASSEQYSDPICVLQWMAETAIDPTERAALRAEILNRLMK